MTQIKLPYGLLIDGPKFESFSISTKGDRWRLFLRTVDDEYYFVELGHPKKVNPFLFIYHMHKEVHAALRAKDKTIELDKVIRIAYKKVEEDENGGLDDV